MSLPTRLSSTEVADRMPELPEWTLVGDRLEREFLFDSFATAFGFMAEVAIAAEKQHHHPEWSNVYNRVTVGLTTHDVDGLSEEDFTLARRMDQAAAHRTQ